MTVLGTRKQKYLSTPATNFKGFPIIFGRDKKFGACLRVRFVVVPDSENIEMVISVESFEI
jgi:hypothetical protein